MNAYLWLRAAVRVIFWVVLVALVGMCASLVLDALIRIYLNLVVIVFNGWIAT